MDATKDVIDGAMCRQLSNRDIGMREAVYSATGVRGPHTHFKRELAIDSIRVMADIEVSSAAYLTYDPKLGDHRPVVANTSKKSLLGEGGPQTKSAVARKLNLKMELIRQEYIDRLEVQLKRHNLLARIVILEKEAEGKSGDNSRKALEHLDREIT